MLTDLLQPLTVVFCSLRAEGGTRRGNMGHLTRISNMVVQNLEKGPVQAQISDLIKGRRLLQQSLLLQCLLLH